MHTFYLIRHGQKESVIGDPPLTTRGQSQARQTAQFLSQYPISKIITSPALRTQQTAKHIADHLNLTAQVDELLKERMNWGDVSNQPFDEFMREWIKATHDRDYQPSGFTSSHSTGQRIENAIEKHATAEHPHIAIVTHGGAIADFLRNIISQEALEPIMKEFPLGRDYNVTECSVTIVTLDKGKFKLEMLVCDDFQTSI